MDNGITGDVIYEMASIKAVTVCDSLKRHSLFTEQVVSVWNSLPDNVVFSSLSRFKQLVTKVDFSHFLKRMSNHVLYNIDYIILFIVCFIFLFLCVFGCFFNVLIVEYMS